MRSTFLQKAEEFLDRYGRHGKISFVAGDASARQYYRVDFDYGGSALVMYAPPPEDPALFCRIADMLRFYGVRTPGIWEADGNFLLIDDFGDMTFTKALAAGYQEAELYQRAVQTLFFLRKNCRKQPGGLPLYDTSALLSETLLFLDWFWPYVRNGELPSEAVRRDYAAQWTALFDQCTLPKTLVLRDFHVDNLMLLPDEKVRCGVLDFQDARWGSPIYDLVSLCEDARRDVDPSVQEMCWQWFAQAFPEDPPEQVRAEAAIISAGRHLKILGIFVRLAVRDEKPAYLVHLPRVWRLLQQCLAHPVLIGMQAWMQEHMGENPLAQTVETEKVAR